MPSVLKPGLPNNITRWNSCPAFSGPGEIPSSGDLPCGLDMSVLYTAPLNFNSGPERNHAPQGAVHRRNTARLHDLDVK